MKIAQILRGSVLVLGLIGTGCTFVAETNDQPTVVTSFYPYAYLVSELGGDHMTVISTVPNGVEPHEYAPTPQDIVKLTTADIVVYNGGGIDPWVESIPNTDYSQADVIQLRALADDQVDPHIWLDPVAIQPLIQNLAEALRTVDPDHAATYTNNEELLLQQFHEIDQAYTTQLANCTNNKIIVAHDAFTYLAERYGIEPLPLLGVNPEETPSAQTIAELSALAKNNNIHYIFFESLVNPKLSEVIANDIGATTLELSPLEGLSEADQAAGLDFVDVMYRNLDHLVLAMDCQ